MIAFTDKTPLYNTEASGRIVGDPTYCGMQIKLAFVDKLKRGKAATALLKVTRELDDRATVQLFSALNRQGVDEAQEILGRFLKGNAHGPAAGR